MNQNNQVNQPQILTEEVTIDIRSLFNLFLRGWYWFLIFPLLMGVSAYMYLRYIIPQYEVKSSILIKSDNQGGLGTDMLSQELLGYGTGQLSEMTDEARILTSRSIVREVVEDLKLQSTIYKDGRIKDTDLYDRSPILVDSFSLSKKIKGAIVYEAKIIDSNNFILIKNEKEYKGVFDSLLTNEFGSYLFRYNPNADLWDDGEYIIKLSTTFNKVLEYQRRINVNYNNGSSVVDLSMVDEVPKRCEDILNKLITVYNLVGIEDKNAVGRNTLEFIDERLLIITDELQGIERGIQGVKEREKITVDPESDLSFLYGQMGIYGQQLTDLEVQKDALSILDNYLKKGSNKYELVPLNLQKNESLVQLIVKLNEAIQLRRRLLQTLTIDNPNIISLDDEISNYRYQLQENIENIQNDINNTIRKIRAKSSDFELQLRKTPRKERELLEVKRQQAIKENLYLFLLEKREETAISLAATIEAARVLDRPALTQIKPVSPNRSSILAGAVLIGLVLAVGAIILREFLIDTIQSEDEIKSLTQVPVLGAIAESKKESKIVVSKSSRSAIAEMFRLLRTNLQFTLAGKPHKTMLVTSSMSGEGKSFISINLGMSFALSGKKVIIIGLDLRKPKMASYLVDNIPTKGISSYLIDAATKDEIINSSGINENFDFIASGPIPPNPSELILNGRLDILIEELKQTYDVIIIDTPPVGLVTDSLLLKSIVNTSIYVTRFSYTKRSQLRLINQLYKENKLINPTIVFNGVKRGRGYGYGYGYGYYDDDK
jgi:tyrosine-protein kinase Etk/Wzc